jgi:hypothetical protein
MKHFLISIIVVGTFVGCKAYTPQAEKFTAAREQRQADADAKAALDAAAEAEQKRILALQESIFNKVISSLDQLETEKAQRSETFPSIILNGQIDYALVGNEPKSEATNKIPAAKLQDTDEIDEKHEAVELSPEDLAAAKVKNIIKKDSSAKSSPKGRCILFNASDLALETSGGSGSEIAISENGKVAYSASDELKPADCQTLFKGKLGERIIKDYFNMHISYFQMN